MTDSMGTFIAALNDSFGAGGQALWAAIAATAPVISTLVLFGIGYTILKRVLGGARRAKAKI